MFRISHFIFIAMAIWTAGLLFWTSQSVQQAQKELRALKSSKHGELEMVRVLSSEWDYLNRPERLEELARTYLAFDNVGIDDMKLLTSVELVKDSVSPVVPAVKPEKSFELVSQKSNDFSSDAKTKEVVISKPEQDNFNSFIETLSDGGVE